MRPELQPEHAGCIPYESRAALPGAEANPSCAPVAAHLWRPIAWPTCAAAANSPVMHPQACHSKACGEQLHAATCCHPHLTSWPRTNANESWRPSTALMSPLCTNTMPPGRQQAFTSERWMGSTGREAVGMWKGRCRASKDAGQARLAGCIVPGLHMLHGPCQTLSAPEGPSAANTTPRPLCSASACPAARSWVYRRCMGRVRKPCC